MEITLNSRFRNRPVTGVERFAGEVTKRLTTRENVAIHEVQPAVPLAGFRGHAWEQFSLPRKIMPDSILFSPCNTGPVSVKNQLAVIHDAAVWDCPEAFSRSFRMLYQNLLPALANQAATVATVSEFSRGRLAQYLRIPAEKIHVLGNATGPEFTPGPEFDPTAPPIFLCAGSLDPRKNFHRLIAAWIGLTERKQLPDGARLHIVGGANPANFSQFDHIDAPGIHWLGRVTDAELIEQYQTATAFIFPSLYEGFGLPPLEAMACGCPVLLSDKASLPEIGGPGFDVTSGNGAALYFDPLSESEITGAIQKFLSYDAKTHQQMRINALKHTAGFTWEAVADRTLSVLQSIS